MTKTSDAFLQAAIAAMCFLEDDHGFKIVEKISPPEVRSNLTFYKLMYERIVSFKSILFVSISTCPYRLELDLEMGRGASPRYEDTINVHELLAIESPGAQLELSTGIYEAFGDAQKMLEQYSALACVLRRYGGRFFASDPSLWEDVQRRRMELAKELHCEQVSRAADAAFRRGDWSETLELLESLGDNQSKLETARLAYIQKCQVK